MYVGGLSPETTEDDLRDAVRDFGHIFRLILMRDKGSDHPRGFAFVEMSNEAETRAVIRELSEKRLNGRKLVAFPYPSVV